MESHLRYITRPSAARIVFRARVHDSDTLTAQNAEESAKKRKGRVAERFIIALPIETDAKQREELAIAFAERITDKKAGYIVAIHDKQGNDLHNPHMHLVAFDKFEKTGCRGRPRSVMGMARKGAIEEATSAWVATHNEKMREWGFDAISMISQLSNRARGIGKIPTIHEGPALRNLQHKGKIPKINEKWKQIDSGHTRIEANNLIREINKLISEGEDAQQSYRLGSATDRNKPPSKKSFAEQRTHAVSLGGSAPKSEATAKNSATNCRETGGPPNPTFLNRQKSRKGESRRFKSGRPETTPLAHHTSVVRSSHRSIVRRIWYELIFLRDTLGARILASRSAETSGAELKPPLASASLTKRTADRDLVAE